MEFQNFFNSGYSFNEDEYELENRFILGNALLLAITVNMLFFTIIMFTVDFKPYILIHSLTVLVSLLLIAILRVIGKYNLDIFGNITFFAYMLLIFYTYSQHPLDFPVTSWFALLIIPSLIIHGHRFALILAVSYFLLLWVFYKILFGDTNLALVLTEFPPLFLTMWFVYFYHQRYRDSLNVIKEKHAYLIHQSRMASMGEMIENIAHQWRQPLSQINSSVLLLDGILKQKNVEDTRIEEKLLEIESLTEYMSRTIDDFKNFFERDKTLTFYGLDEVLNEVYKIIRSLLRKNNIHIEYIKDEDIRLKGYPNELQQVLLVIINNAIDSLIDRKITEPQILISASVTNKSLKILIEDNAGGIDENEIDKVFYPYFTTKKEKDGSGVGLYMSKMIIEESMHGTLDVENTEKGACFIISIPQILISYKT